MLFRFGRTREQIGRRYALDRAARAVPRRRGAGQYVGLDGSARRIGRSARCRSRPGRRSVPRRRGSSTTRCWPRTQQHGSPATVTSWSARSASTEEGDSTSDSEIDARPPRIAYNASGVDQWAFRPVIRSGCVKRSLVSVWNGHGNGRQQRWIGRNAGRPGRVTRRRGPVLATNSTGRGRRVAVLASEGGRGASTSGHESPLPLSLTIPPATVTVRFVEPDPGPLDVELDAATNSTTPATVTSWSSNPVRPLTATNGNRR